jgi:hypothetical protein
MKKILYLILLCPLFLFAEGVRNIGDDYQLIYNVLDIQGNYISGQSIELKIKKVSTNTWYDFNDSSFKSSGWTSKTTPLLEDTTNYFYHYTFSPPSSETDPEQYIFVVNNPSSQFKDQQMISITYQKIGTSDFNGVVVIDTTTVYNGVTNAVNDNETITRMDKDTNGVKDNGIWNGIEKLIKQEK